MDLDVVNKTNIKDLTFYSRTFGRSVSFTWKTKRFTNQLDDAANVCTQNWNSQSIHFVGTTGMPEWEGNIWDVRSSVCAGMSIQFVDEGIQFCTFFNCCNAGMRYYSISRLIHLDRNKHLAIEIIKLIISLQTKTINTFQSGKNSILIWIESIIATVEMKEADEEEYRTEINQFIYYY